MTGKIAAIVICLSAIFTRSGAQELGIELDAGLQGTQYQLQTGQVKQLPGGSFGLTYSFRLGSRWDLVTGIIGGIYRTQASLPDSAHYSYGQVDDAGSAFQFDVKTTGYKETQEFLAAGIPLLLQYHTTGAKRRWYINAGGRALFPLTANIRQTAQQLSLSGYYPDYNLVVSNLPQHGFGTIDNWKASQTVELRPAAVLSAATGFSFRVSRGTRLYTGIYVDYGLTDLKSGGDSLPFVTYSSTGISKVQANSVLKMSIAGPMSALSFGIQVRLSFGSAKTKSAPRPKQKEATPQPPMPAIGDLDTAIIQKPVLFGSLGETFIPETQMDHLDSVASILLQNPRVRVSIVGHICNSGTETENVKVGEERAKAVAAYLETKGIDRNRMDIGFLHESDPVMPYNPAANFQKRRVVIKVE